MNKDSGVHCSNNMAYHLVSLVLAEHFWKSLSYWEESDHLEKWFGFTLNAKKWSVYFSPKTKEAPALVYSKKVWDKKEQ